VTDKREGAFLRHDLLVVLVALAVIAGGWAASAYGLVPGTKKWSSGGVTFSYPADWLAVSSQEDALEARGEDAVTRLVFETWMKPQHALVTCDAYLELDRAQRFPLYERLSSEVRRIKGKDWLVTHYAYAAKAGSGFAPQVVQAAEYAYPANFEVNRENLSIVTIHASNERLPALEAELVSTLDAKGP
jgi:hypothetical protein